MNSPWRCLEEVPGFSAVAAEWRRHTGEAFDAIREGFLQKANRKASSFPCPHKDGCTHQVKPRGAGYVGICKDDDGTGCDDILLTAEDVEVWEVNLSRLGRRIASALKCEVKDVKLGLDRTRQIASLGSAPLAILLTIQHDEDGFSNVVARLVTRWPKGFILLAPTNRFCTAPATELLGKANAGFFSLESHVTVLASGNLHAAKSGGELFAAYLPEKKESFKESETQRVFRLFRELMSLGAHLKAPPGQVFDLMVFKGHPQNRTARLCKCVPSLLTKRVNGSTFVDACAKLGDRADRLTAVAMHSATEAALRKLDLIDFIPDSEGKAQLRTFQGRRVVVDDNVPTRAGSTDGTVYTSYLFGQGAFAKGSAMLESNPLQGGFGTEGVEIARSALDSDTLLINRRRYLLHPRGVKFNSASVAGDSPTNAELETASNWTRVWENKNVRIVAVTHNN